MENVINIAELLKSSTYQGMTDEEISAIITYRTQEAAREATVSNDAREHGEIMRKLIERQDAAQKAAAKSLENALAMQPVYKEVRYE